MRLGRRRSVWIFSIVLGFLCASSLGACVELGPRGPYPKHVYTDLRTELVFDGKRIVVEGTSQCTRSGNFRSSGKLQIGYIGARGPMYLCSPKWFGKRLPDGSALLVGAYSVTGKWGTFPDYAPPDLTKHRERVAKVPRAVIWLDDAESPTRGEYYYSAIALDDPRSRLSEIESEVVRVEEGSLLGRTVTDPADEVPWVGGGRPPARLIAGHANVIPKSIWSTVPGLSEALASYRDPIFLVLGKDITTDQRRRLNRYGLAAPERIHHYQWPSPDATIFPVSSLRNSKDHYLISQRRASTRRIDGTLQLAAEFPKGVLPLTSEGAFQNKGISRLKLGGKTLAINEWTQFLRALYDPQTGNIYRFFVARFTPGHNGDAYTTPLR